jgi:hypothetical protein
MATKLQYCIDEDLFYLADVTYSQAYDIDQQGGAIADVFYEDEMIGKGWVGSLFRWFKPMVMPFISAGAKALGKQALSTAGGLIGDLSSGANVREASEQRVGEALTNLNKKFKDKMARMAGAGQQYGGKGRNKTLHNAVKLFSFTPPAGVSGGRITRRRKTRARGSAVTKRKTTRRRRQTASIAGSKGRKRQSRRRKKTASAKRRRRARTATSKRRKAPSSKRKVTRRRRASPRQRGGGEDFGGWL